MTPHVLPSSAADTDSQNNIFHAKSGILQLKQAGSTRKRFRFFFSCWFYSCHTFSVRDLHFQGTLPLAHFIGKRYIDETRTQKGWIIQERFFR